MAQHRTPRAVSTFTQFVLATGGRRLLRVGDPRLLAGYFDISATIPDNTTLSADLRLGSVHDLRVQGFYSNADAPIEAVLRIEAVQLYVNDPNYRDALPAVKESIDNLAYIKMVRNGNTMNLPLRGAICDAWSQPAGLTTAQLAIASDRASAHGRVRKLERPLQVDLKTDQFLLNIDTAIDLAAAIDCYVRVWGHMAPRDFDGAMVSDTNACAASAEVEDASSGPVEFVQSSLAGFGSSLMDIPSGQLSQYP